MSPIERNGKRVRAKPEQLSVSAKGPGMGKFLFIYLPKVRNPCRALRNHGQPGRRPTTPQGQWTKCSICYNHWVRTHKAFTESHRKSRVCKQTMSGQVAQLVERSPEKAGVGGSIPSLATILTPLLSATSRRFARIVQSSYSGRRIGHSILTN